MFVAKEESLFLITPLSIEDKRLSLLSLLGAFLFTQNPTGFHYLNLASSIFIAPSKGWIARFASSIIAKPLRAKSTLLTERGNLAGVASGDRKTLLAKFLSCRWYIKISYQKSRYVAKYRR